MPYIHVEEGDKIGTGLTHSQTPNHDADDQNAEDDLDNYDNGDREKSKQDCPALLQDRPQFLSSLKLTVKLDWQQRRWC